MGIASFTITPSVYVPVGKYSVDVDRNLVLVHPEYIDEFMDRLTRDPEVYDVDGHKAFAM